MLRETTMSSSEHLKQLVRDKLESAAEEIFAVFHRLIVDYEEELDRHRKFLVADLKPVVKLHRTELPQKVVIMEEVIVEDQAPLNQDKNSSQDQEEPEPPQLEEQQQEESSLGLRLKQEPGELQLCSAEVKGTKSEDQSVDWHFEEPDVNTIVITSVVSEANSDLQQCSLSAGVSPTGAQKEGDQEFESEIPTQRPLGKNHCVLTTGLENPGPGSSRCGTLLQHQVMRKKNVCQDCGKNFSGKSNLTRHKIEVHTCERSYACQTCDKIFFRWADLISHNRVHRGERSFVCDTCGKSFSRRTNLTSHRRYHTGERPYVCKECGRGFVSSAALRKHVKKGV